jgi:dsRNA-specific ribonuclease
MKYCTLFFSVLFYFGVKSQQIDYSNTRPGEDVEYCTTHKKLQELLQARRLALPVYTVIEQTGAVHKQIFTVECRVEALNQATQAQGSNRRQAEQAAATLMLNKI